MNELKSLAANTIIIQILIIVLILPININSWKLVWSEEFNDNPLNSSLWQMEAKCKGQVFILKVELQLDQIKLYFLALKDKLYYNRYRINEKFVKIATH
jgi:hypothetical protein